MTSLADTFPIARQSPTFGLEVHIHFLYLAAVAGVFGALVAVVIGSETAEMAGWRLVLPGFAVAAGSTVLSVLLHEGAHAVGIRLCGFRGRILVFLADGGDTGPVLFHGRKKAVVALAGPVVDLLVVMSVTAAWSRWSGGALGALLGASASVLLVLPLISLTAGHNDVTIAKDAWRESGNQQ